MLPEIKNREAGDWAKAIVLGVLAYLVFFIPNSVDGGGFTTDAFLVPIVETGGILSAIVAFISAIWE